MSNPPALISDIWSIALKEWKEMFLRRGSVRGGVFSMLAFPIGLMGIVLPLQAGREWFGLPAFACNGIWLPQLLVLGVVADSFAGERERHTLETLLATRLSDRAILLGKLFANVGYAFAVAMLSTLIGWAVIAMSAAQAGQGWVGYAPGVLISIVVFAALSASLASGIGVLVSLRSATVRQAQQSLSMITLGLTFGVLLLITAAPDPWKRAIGGWFQTADGTSRALIAAFLLGAIDLGLFLACRTRFRRSSLILD